MNELIEKIYGETCLAAGNLDEREFCEKFAELIVRECGNWIVENAGALEHLGPNYFAKAMNKHFGVEE